MRKNIILTFLCCLLFCCKVFSSMPQDALRFFEKYSQYANSYREELLDLYSPDVKIVREVIKPDGKTESVVIPPQRFFTELKIGQKTAKLRKYKNKYRNITVKQVQNGIKISAERQPVRETYWLKMYQILQPSGSGFVIKEEMMQTKVQTFLKHKQRGK